MSHNIHYVIDHIFIKFETILVNYKCIRSANNKRYQVSGDDQS